MAKYEPEHILTDPSFDKAKRQIEIWRRREEPETMKNHNMK